MPRMNNKISWRKCACLQVNCCLHLHIPRTRVASACQYHMSNPHVQEKRARVNHRRYATCLVQDKRTQYYYVLRKHQCTQGALAAAEPRHITGNMHTQSAFLEVSGRALPPLLHGMITPYHHDLSYNMG